MNQMSIQLLDLDYEEFMFCNFSKALLSYRNTPKKLMEFSLSEWYIHESAFCNSKSNSKFEKRETFEMEDDLSLNSKENKKKNNPFLSSKRFFGED